jgi:uncharacterized damage-inducible protein DinB
MLRPGQSSAEATRAPSIESGRAGGAGGPTMTDANPHVIALERAKAWFSKTASALEGKDSAFAPAEGMFTAAQQVAHVAQTVDWFVEGAFEREGGVDPDFEKHDRLVREVESLAKAKAWLDRSFDKAMRILATKSEAELDEPFGDEVLGDMPKRSLVNGIVDHTAHHRGSVAVYARLLGKTPPMPYL